MKDDDDDQTLQGIQIKLSKSQETRPKQSHEVENYMIKVPGSERKKSTFFHLSHFALGWPRLELGGSSRNKHFENVIKKLYALAAWTSITHNSLHYHKCWITQRALEWIFGRRGHAGERVMLFGQAGSRPMTCLCMWSRCFSYLTTRIIILSLHNRPWWIFRWAHMRNDDDDNVKSLIKVTFHADCCLYFLS